MRYRFLIPKPGPPGIVEPSHIGLIARNLDKHRGEGKTVLIMFGAGHKYWFLEQLKKGEDIKLVSLLDYLAK